MIAVYGIRGRLNRLPAACSGDMVLATVKKVVFFTNAYNFFYWNLRLFHVVAFHEIFVLGKT